MGEAFLYGQKGENSNNEHIEVETQLRDCYIWYIDAEGNAQENISFSNGDPSVNVLKNSIICVKYIPPGTPDFISDITISGTSNTILVSEPSIFVGIIKETGTVKYA